MTPLRSRNSTRRPEAALANHGLEDACAADVQAVKPVIVDDAHGHRQDRQRAAAASRNDDNEVVREISRIVHQFTTVDARSTIVDQSVNQDIWTNGGDVTQIFDQGLRRRVGRSRGRGRR